MRIMVVSDMVEHRTGYGVTAKSLCLALMRDGHTVANYAPGAFHMANVQTPDGITILGSNGADDRWGNGTLDIQVRTFQPDLIITWLDCQGLGNYGLDGTPTYMWAPIDTRPTPEHEMSILYRADKVLVCSRWGKDELRNQGLDATYVPCGIDMTDFDIDPAGREEWRALWGFEPGQFVVGMVGMNAGSPDRKGYGYAFDVLARFHQRHPDAGIYLHTNPGSDGSSMDLRDLAKAVGLEDVVKFPEYPGTGGYPPKYMRHAYNGMDVMLHTSLTEGFGLPVVEAQACGTPVVFNDATSVTELVKDGSGFGAAPLTWMWVGGPSRIAVPDVDNLERELERAYATTWNRQKIRESVSEYDFEHTYRAYWQPVLASVPAKLEIKPDARKLRLGAGSDNDPSFTNHDRDLYFEHIDVAHDLNILPWPFADNAYDYIEMSDVIEHLTVSVTDVMDELHRITAPDGHVMVHTVKANSWQHHHDPTHTRGFEVTSFDYYDPDTDWGKQYRYSEREWRILKKTIEPKGGVMVVLTPRKTADVAVPR